MKRSVSIMMLLLSIVSGMQASTNPMYPTNRCRLGLNYENAFVFSAEKTKEDLLSGIWISGADFQNEIHQTWMFEQTGKLNIFNETTEAGIKVDERTWKVVDFEGSVFLMVSSPNNKAELHFKVNPTCNGMELQNIQTGETHSFDYTVIKSKVSNGSDITGSWICNQYPFEISQRFDQVGSFETVKGAFLNLEINTDGTYSKSFGSEIKCFTEKGQWRLSKDGKYILLIPSLTQNPKNVAMEALEIQKIKGDKLVIKTAITSTENISAFKTNTRNFQFIRCS